MEEEEVEEDDDGHDASVFGVSPYKALLAVCGVQDREYMSASEGSTIVAMHPSSVRRTMRRREHFSSTMRLPFSPSDSVGDRLACSGCASAHGHFHSVPLTASTNHTRDKVDAIWLMAFGCSYSASVSGIRPGPKSFAGIDAASESGSLVVRGISYVPRAILRDPMTHAEPNFSLSNNTIETRDVASG